MTDAALDLTGRRAVVTGASSGIGAAIAVRLADAGADVVAVSRSGRAPEAEGSIRPLVADLSDPGGVDGVIPAAVAELGGLDILVNNAGRADWLPLSDLDREHFDGLIGLNLWAPLRLCQLAHPHLAAGGDSAVVMIGSVDAVRPSAGGAVYGASKAGLAAMTVALAKEWRDDGIRVTQVDPGIVDTPMAAEIIHELDAAGAPVNIAGRAGEPGEIAALVHYLVAPAGRFANGASFRLDGGALALGPFDNLER
ncbi:MAG: SDR family oxidoreductase [Acidimicrobiaceae bacterium]|nr:SDR family oxidoreductase [Acidimicrobiaceae bacterium]MYE74906.1 SDR family oxidoreductase [Acidimicrobiaceae bacterium]MYH44520.1 SDR family oxidoreductase [Acidimicrobiaceae bacterium]MYJ42605.1 SDR family oxidoreductase [Acidimicrobiaceae bacterium]MYJ82546.1 SDR family oxidoreductase [Acidimicrobiaceae bacterium]